MSTIAKILCQSIESTGYTLAAVERPVTAAVGYVLVFVTHCDRRSVLYRRRVNIAIVASCVLCSHTLTYACVQQYTGDRELQGTHINVNVNIIRNEQHSSLAIMLGISIQTYFYMWINAWWWIIFNEHFSHRKLQKKLYSSHHKFRECAIGTYELSRRSKITAGEKNQTSFRINLNSKSIPSKYDTYIGWIDLRNTLFNSTLNNIPI